MRSCLYKEKEVMQSFINLLNLCYRYKREEFDIKEFQSRILTANMPANASKELVEALADADNQLERIIFCAAPENAGNEGKDVADMLIAAIEKERNVRG